MTVPIRPDDFDAVGFAKAARKQGYTVAQIAEVLERRGHGQYAKELRGSEADTPRNFGMQAADGAAWGLMNPLAAAGGAAVQKLSGDDRDLVSIYRQLRDDANLRSGVYRDANPGKALTGNVVGAVVSGKLNPLALKVPGVGNATWGGRALNTGANAAGGAGAASLLNTEENLRSVQGATRAAKDAATAAAVGGVAGTVLSPLMEGGGNLLKGAYRMLPDAIREGVEAVPTQVAKAMPRAASSTLEMQGGPTAARAAAPTMDPGAARVINRLQAQGLTLDQLEALSKQADGPDILAELIGEKGVRELGTANILGNRAPDQIRTMLDERAAGESDRWLAALERLMPTPTMDRGTFRATTMAGAKAEADPRYGLTKGLGVPGPETAGVVGRLRQLKDDGLDIWKLAKLADETMPAMPEPEEPTGMTVGQLQRLRQVLDDKIQYGQTDAPMGSIERVANERLRSLRADVDRIAKARGGTPFQEADAFIATGEGQSESFEAGYRAAQMARNPDEVTRLKASARDAEAFRQGMAAYRQEQALAVRDGGAGGITNPFAPAMATERARAVTQGALADPSTMPELEQLATSGANRLRTRGATLGNSATMQRGADVAEAVGGMVNPLEVGAAMMNPVDAGKRGLSALWQPAARRILGDEMDAMAPYLMAGGPGQQTREEAIAKLRELYPVLQAKWAQDVLLRSRAGAAIGERSTRR